jgi:hypothetical protein
MSACNIPVTTAGVPDPFTFEDSSPMPDSAQGFTAVLENNENVQPPTQQQKQ